MARCWRQHCKVVAGLTQAARPPNLAEYSRRPADVIIVGGTGLPAGGHHPIPHIIATHEALGFRLNNGPICPSPLSNSPSSCSDSLRACFRRSSTIVIVVIAANTTSSSL